MTTVYTLKLYTPAGVQVAEIDNYQGLTYTKRVNEPGLLRFTLPGNDSRVASLVDKAQIEVWRENTAWGITRAADFYGLVRKVRRTYTDTDICEVTCPGQMSMLGWRTVAWTANYADRSAFTSDKAETIMKTLVTYNCTASATTGNGRLRNGAITGVTVEADGAGGETLDWFCSYDNLLATLQQCALVAGGDFDLVKTGAQAWEFRWYTGQRGTDRSASVWFALDRGNMEAPEYTIDHTDEATVAIVGGQGEEAARTTAVRTGTDYVSGSVDYEMFVDARDCTTAAALNARGDAALEKAQARDRFTFRVLQVPASAYGLHYVLGDLATAYYLDITATVKIVGVTVTAFQGGGEQVDIETESV